VRPGALKIALAAQEIKFIFSGAAVAAEYYLYTGYYFYYALTIIALYESFSETEKVNYWQTLAATNENMGQ